MPARFAAWVHFLFVGHCMHPIRYGLSPSTPGTTPRKRQSFPAPFHMLHVLSERDPLGFLACACVLPAQMLAVSNLLGKHASLKLLAVHLRPSLTIEPHKDVAICRFHGFPFSPMASSPQSIARLIAVVSVTL
jgi:hypothetical protein